MSNQKTVLITDDDPAFVQALARRCEGLNLQVQTASDGLETMMLVAKQPPDLLIIDVHMPAVDGLSVCEKLIEDPSIPPIALIMLTGASDRATIQRCQSLGAHYIHKDLEIWPNLSKIISSILDQEAPAAEEATAQVPTVLIVDDDPQIVKAVSVRLRACGFDVLRASNGMQGYWRTIKNMPDAIITDYMMPEGSGERFLMRLKENASTKHIPVIVLTGRKYGGRTDHALQREVVGRMGAAALVTKPYDFKDLLNELKRYIVIPEPK